jgi:hypothetical protein
VVVCFFTGTGSSAILSAASGDVCLATDDGFNAVALHRVVERDGAKHIPVIGHGTGGHAEFFGFFGQRFYLYRAVEKAVIGV